MGRQTMLHQHAPVRRLLQGSFCLLGAVMCAWLFRLRLQKGRSGDELCLKIEFLFCFASVVLLLFYYHSKKAERCCENNYTSNRFSPPLLNFCPAIPIRTDMW